MVANCSEGAAFKETGFGGAGVVSVPGREEVSLGVAAAAGVFGRASATPMTTAGTGRSVGAGSGCSKRTYERSMAAAGAAAGGDAGAAAWGGAINRWPLSLFAPRVDGMNVARATMTATRAEVHGVRTA